MSTVRIPLRGSHEGEVLEVTPDQLPDDAQDLVSILKEHKPPIIIWLQVAVRFAEMHVDPSLLTYDENSGRVVAVLQNG
jgi:hypothetical protein